LFYHGSPKELDIGKIINPRPYYENDWGQTDFYKALEKYRPKKYISHKNGVFMCDNEDDVDLCGGSTEYIYLVEPIGIVQKHDLNWGSEISCLISEGISIQDELIHNAAYNYWEGFPHRDENVWEYITEKFIIKELIYQETYTITPN
jgi:hypothetical protein